MPATMTVLQRPKDPELVRRLEVKLLEYLLRSEQCTRHPALRQPAILKERLLSALLERGEVVPDELIQAFKEEIGDSFDPQAAEQAVTVIEAYCAGKMPENSRGGTGLPPFSGTREGWVSSVSKLNGTQVVLLCPFEGDLGASYPIFMDAPQADIADWNGTPVRIQIEDALGVNLEVLHDRKHIGTACNGM